MAKKVYNSQEQAETAKQRAVTFLRNVVQNDERADEVEGESLEDWLEETGRRIQQTNNPRSNSVMATRTELQNTLDQISDMISDALDPALSREEVIEKLQEMDGSINGDDMDDSDDSDSDLEDEDDSD